MSPETVLEAGFTDPVLESQGAFRAMMSATARPGHIEALSGIPQVPPPLSPVAAALVLTLIDHDTPVWLDPPLADSQAVRGWLAFHTGAPVVDAGAAASFAVIANFSCMPPLDIFALGTDAYPDRSTTLVVQVLEFDREGPELTGPGVDGTIRLGARPLPSTFWRRLRENNAMFPRGVDILLAGPEGVAALPRSLRIGDD